jgi:beta-glucosidase
MAIKSRYIALAVFLTACHHAKPPLSMEARVKDLIGRMTLDEKIGQMMNAAPAIPRLGIPEYNWWNECLHGVARSGLATVFPQAIGLGAAWDTSMQFRVATAISDEARAKYAEYQRKGKRLIYQGLTFWSPNINIFRDPRWGRGQETYGEDPYLTGMLAVQFVRGLQGDDPVYFKTIATVKHFAVHSGPEPERHSFDALADERDFRETYLPQFERGVRQGGAYSLMCAYNRFEGQACCGSSRLLTDILRKEWGFSGYVVSDCGAIADIYQRHHVAADAASAAALAVRAGCDLECDTTYMHLHEAVNRGLISEADIDTALARLFLARFRLGMFGDKTPYDNIPYSVVDDASHKALALEAAHKSIVLLKNSDHLLPLSPGKTVAVIGPNADDAQMLLGNYNGLPSDPITPLRGIRAAAAKVIYARGCALAEGLPTFEKVPVSGLQASYFGNDSLHGSPVFSRADSLLDANWGDGAPRADMDPDNFGVRWTGTVIPDRFGAYELGVITTCRVRIYLNDSLVAFTSYHFRNEFNDPRLAHSLPLTLAAGKTYRIRVEAGETYGDARVQLVWSRPVPDRAAALRLEALDAARRADVVVMCMGLSARLEGEEMDVNIEGFKGGDRTNLDLPAEQEALIRDVAALGKPVVLVLLNGSALAVNWEQEHLPAILEAWYPGQAAGTAIADVLFGKYNPGGRLPVTFYHSVHDLPAFTDYRMAGHTYRYFAGKVLYPFGYGLSYTTFAYDSLDLPPVTRSGDSVHLSVRVTNTGSMAGDEVVQVYVSRLHAPVPVPIRSLAGFRRIHLEPGASVRVRLTLEPGAFSLVDSSMHTVIPPGRFSIFVGGGQPPGPGLQGILSLQDTLTAQVAKGWLKGTTSHLKLLEVSSLRMEPGVLLGTGISHPTELFIVTGGGLEASLNEGDPKHLGPGGICLLMSSDKVQLSNEGDETTEYIRVVLDRGRIDTGASEVLDWKDLPVQANAHGATRPAFTLPLVNMHATTLNPGESPHAPHTHEAEEMIILLQGRLGFEIGGKGYAASPGEVVFIPSGVLHGLRNVGTDTAEYFAVQWK